MSLNVAGCLKLRSSKLSEQQTSGRERGRRYKCSLTFFVSPDERQEIDDAAYRARITRSALLRQRVLGKRPVVDARPAMARAAAALLAIIDRKYPHDEELTQGVQAIFRSLGS